MPLCDLCQVAISTEIAGPGIDAANHKVGRHYLQARLWLLFTLLYERQGRIVSVDVLGWLYIQSRSRRKKEIEDVDNTLKVSLHHLRRSLRDTPYRIENVWGEGYRMTVAADESNTARAC